MQRLSSRHCKSHGYQKKAPHPPHEAFYGFQLHLRTIWRNHGATQQPCELQNKRKGSRLGAVQEYLSVKISVHFCCSWVGKVIKANFKLIQRGINPSFRRSRIFFFLPVWTVITEGIRFFMTDCFTQKDMCRSGRQGARCSDVNLFRGHSGIKRVTNQYNCNLPWDLWFSSWLKTPTLKRAKPVG